MGATVTFDPAAWRERFPEFADVSDALAEDFFAEATDIWANDGSGPVNDAARQLRILNMLTAHIAKVSGGASGGGGNSGLVGRVSSATEGSVTVQVEAAQATQSTQWFMQSQYGASYLQMIAPYINFRSVMPTTRAPNPYSRGF